MKISVMRTFLKLINTIYAKSVVLYYIKNYKNKFKDKKVLLILFLFL